VIALVLLCIFLAIICYNRGERVQYVIEMKTGTSNIKESGAIDVV